MSSGDGAVLGISNRIIFCIQTHVEINPQQQVTRFDCIKYLIYNKLT